MAKKKYSCDFETTTDPKDCRVWAYGWMEIGNKKNYKIGNSIEDFMVWLRESDGILYFHNLRFDGEFIVNWLLKNGFEHNDSGKENTFSTVISGMGQWYIVDICYGYRKGKKMHTVIYDSLKKLPFKVKEIAKDFKLPIEKGDIDYHVFRPKGHNITPLEYSYIKNDIEIIADALAIQFEQGLDRITNGSDSMHGFKSIISKKKYEKMFPVFSLELDQNIRMAYRGGFTWLNDRFEGVDVEEGIVLDVNSLYPAQMYTRSLPYGMPIFYHGKYEDDEQYPLYIQHIKCDFELKEGRIPTIQLKKNLMFKENQYLKSSNGEYPSLYVTNIDLEMILEHYDVYDLQYCEGWKFRQQTGIFKDFIEKWTYIKMTESGAKKLLAKLMLNSLYGKFASNPNITGKIPYLKEDGSCAYKLGDEEYKDPIYTPMGVFITSWARYETIGTAQKCFDRIIYCDTDSLHLTGTEIPDAIKDRIDSNKLGYWDHEATFKRAKYVRQKTYCYDIYAKEIEKDGEIKVVSCSKEESTLTKFTVKCAGMSDDVKKLVTFDNFKQGLKLFGKLMPKHVDGGIVLLPTEFTIK